MVRPTFVLYLNLGDRPELEELAITLVVDDSGSMAGEPVAQVRDAIRTFLSEVPAASRVGLVSFGSAVTTLAPPTEHLEFVADQVDRFEGHSGATILFDAIGEACTLFKDDGRQRYLVVLSDGQDNASEAYAPAAGAAGGHEDLVAHARRHGVRVFGVGFGDADHDALGSLCAATGGVLLEGGDVAELPSALRSALDEIRTDRQRVVLRREVARLLHEMTDEGSSLPVRHLSVDPWPVSDIECNADYLWFSATEMDHIGGLRVGFASWQDRFREVVEGALRSLPVATGEVRGTGINLVVTGWLHDPVFLALAVPLVSQVLQVRHDLRAVVPGQVFPLFVPLLSGVPGRDQQLRAQMAAWIRSVPEAMIHSAGQPRGVLCLGGGNYHKTLNPGGFTSATADDVLVAAAPVLAALACNSGLVSTMVGYGAGHADRVHAAGAAVLAAGSRRRAMAAAARRFRDLVQTVLGRRDNPARWVPAAGRAWEASRLDRRQVIETVLAPLDHRAPEGVLARIRLAVADFWPPPRTMPRDEYLALLPRFIEERSGEYLARKLDVLRRVLARRLGELEQRSRNAVDREVDALLFGADDASLADAAALLGRIAELLGEQVAALGTGAEATANIEVAGLFSKEDAVVADFGKLSIPKARERLEYVLVHRPLGPAFVLRYGLLAALTGILTNIIVGSTPSFLVDVGILNNPDIAALTAGLLVAFLGAAHWYVAGQRVRVAVREYIAALVRHARDAARTECVNRLRAFYRGLLRWTGDRDHIPTWTPSTTRHEKSLSQREIVAILGERLGESAERADQRQRDNPEPENPSVFTPGREVRSQVGEIAVLPDPSARSAADHAVGWSAAGGVSDHSRWREVARRRRCDNLEDYLEFHAERLALPERLHGALSTSIQQQLRRDARAASMMADKTSVVVDALAARAYPTVMLEDNANPPPPESLWLTTTEDSDRFRSLGSAQTGSYGVEPGPTNPSLALLFRRMEIAVQDSIELHSCVEALGKADQVLRSEIERLFAISEGASAAEPLPGGAPAAVGSPGGEEDGL